jgi:prepilin-type N-terminal cleavage/methylation domain-containing protein/prepilin-type processing-associated H-X9-DG protein
MRRAFTLLELLVVIAIIAVLMGLLLPAIQRAREAAATANCQSNLRQIALALSQYESANGRLPPAARDQPLQVWWPHVWPWLEQSALYRRYDFRLAYTDGPNIATLAEVVPLYACPSDRPAPLFGRSRGNYVLNWHDPAPLPFSPTIYGPFGYADGASATKPRQTAFAEITDGLSNTLLASEVVDGGENDQRGDVLIPLPGCVGFVTYLDINSRFPDQLYACTALPPCQVVANWNYAAARSRHPGGVNAARCDGSVSFVSDGIQSGVWRSLGSINGGD